MTRRVRERPKVTKSIIPKEIPFQFKTMDGGLSRKLGHREGSNRILGAHLLRPHVGEVINVLALAIGTGLTAEDLKMTIFAYPIGASDIGYMLWRASR